MPKLFGVTLFVSATLLFLNPEASVAVPVPSDGVT